MRLVVLWSMLYTLMCLQTELSSSPRSSLPKVQMKYCQKLLFSMWRMNQGLRGSRWLSGRKCKTQWLTLGEWGRPLDNGPKLPVGSQIAVKKKNPWSSNISQNFEKNQKKLKEHWKFAVIYAKFILPNQFFYGLKISRSFHWSPVPSSHASTTHMVQDQDLCFGSKVNSGQGR